jgi:hypothetical protein
VLDDIPSAFTRTQKGRDEARRVPLESLLDELPTPPDNR